MTTNTTIPVNQQANHADRMAKPSSHHAQQNQATPLIDAQVDSMVNAVAEPIEKRIQRLAHIKAAQNPLLEAAKPLLLALAQMPKTLTSETEINVFHQLLEQEIMVFHSLCDEANIQRAHITTASYCLCTALDEAASSTQWGGSQKTGEVGAWSLRMLANTFHKDSDGGNKFFLLAGRLATQHEEHIDLLEVMYHILSLGFQGRYRTDPDGRRHLETIQQRLLGMLTTHRAATPPALSAHWRGEQTGKLKLLRSLPMWVTVVVSGLILLALFSWYSYQLSIQRKVVETQIAALNKITPPPAPPLKLAQLLSNEIARGQVTVNENAQQSQMMFKSDAMFVPGQAKINASILPLLNKVAGELTKVNGTVQVIGHSDNRPIKTAQFPHNQALSEARATSVAHILQAGGVPTDRLHIIGQGDSQPLANNQTAAGRAKNRRVEIIVIQGLSKPAHIRVIDPSTPSAPVNFALSPHAQH